MTYLLWFDELRKDDVERVGGKGANLGEMTAAGLAVPPGFCLTARAYRDFIRLSGLEPNIAEALDRLDPADLGDVERRAKTVRQLIEAAPMPDSLREEIVASYRSLSETVGQHELPVAVRSSATAEDLPSASFAGQQETYLNVRGPDALLDHVRLCWGSLWEDRAIVYREKQGFEHDKVALCVVVQAMIESEVAGVMFTANPINGDREQAVITASWGLGEAVVGGLATPDTLTVDRRRRQVLSSERGAKEIMIQYSAEGGTIERSTPSEQQELMTLSDQQALELSDLGGRIESHYGSPQDIEWGLKGGEWYVLQSRPITTLAEPADEYNRTMLVEIFPEALSPAFLSVMGPLIHSMLDFTLEYWGFTTPTDQEAVGIFYNQPYFNRNYIDRSLSSLPDRTREGLVAKIVNPFGHGAERESRELSLPFLRMVGNTLKFMVRFPKLMPRLLTDYQDNIEELERLPIEDLTDADLLSRVRKLCFEDARTLINWDFLMIAVIGQTYETLGTLLERNSEQDTDELRARLISGVTGNITMETNKRMWDLAQVAKATPSVAEVLLSSDEAAVIDLLKNTPEAQAFLAELDQFLSEYGHREIRMDIIYPTWGEDPEPVLSFIRGYLETDEAQSPSAQEERLAEERELLAQGALAQVEQDLLGRLLFSPVYRWVLDQTQLHTRERDTMHFELTRLIPPFRRLLLELGRRWTDQGLIENPEDMFMLTLDEMDEVAESPRPVQDIVRKRRQELERNRKRPWPNIIRGQEEIYAETAEEATEDGAYRGISGSPGTVTGRARVIHGPDDFDSLEQGEILIAPLTTPIWTPLFALAGGVVTEVGGILSHGAIVAREYGIPAVMSVAGATDLFSGGKEVTVDGNRGHVRIEGAASAESTS